MALRISGSHSGGTSSNKTTASTQFMIMQSLMKSSSTTSFNMYTYERMNTRTAEGNDWVYKSTCATARTLRSLSFGRECLEITPPAFLSAKRCLLRHSHCPAPHALLTLDSYSKSPLAEETSPCDDKTNVLGVYDAVMCGKGTVCVLAFTLFVAPWQSLLRGPYLAIKN